MKQTKKQHWLRQLRGSVNITQEELAARLQVAGWNTSRSAINNWENGQNEPPISDPEFRKALAQALRVNVRTMLKLAGYEVDEVGHSIYAEQVATLIDQMPEDKQVLALRLVEQLAKT